MSRLNITEHQLYRVIKESVEQILNEIGYRGASLTHGANYNASISDNTRNDMNAENKMNNANQYRLIALSKAINDNFPNLRMKFKEYNTKTNMVYIDNLIFENIKSLDNNRIVFGGQLSISGQKFNKGAIEYNFNEQKFYRVAYFANGNIRRIFELNTANNPRDERSKINSVLSFISSFMYSEEDYENNINSNGSTLSKKHIPYNELNPEQKERMGL